MLFLFVALTFIFTPIAIFLGLEFLKKFAFMRDFIRESNQLVTWNYQGLDGRKASVRNIVLHGQKPFCALVGFKLDIPILGYSGFDYYGFVRSDSHGVAVISTWMGKGPCQFQFFTNMDLGANPITAGSSENDQSLASSVAFPPHWYQRLGFYG